MVRGTSIRLYQASTSEMFGGGRAINEESGFSPRSPYAVAKLAAHNACGIYRRAYGVRVSCGILFNHESPLRSRDFVTRKITSHLANNDSFTLANVTSVRDWGHAKDYVRAMHLMLQNDPDDFVVATGESHTVLDFLKEAERSVSWKAKYTVVEAEQRPWDVTELSGDASKIHKLGWTPSYSFKGLVRDMMLSDLGQAKIQRLA